MASIPPGPRKRDWLLKPFEKDTVKTDDQNTSGDAISSRPNVTSGDTNKFAAMDTSAVKSEAPKVATDDLWAEAYEECKIRENDLVNCYEQRMKAYTASAGTVPEDHFSPSKIAESIIAQRGDLDARRLTLWKQGEKIVKFVLCFNNTISAALASQPYASLAWSGVSIILPVSDNHTCKKCVQTLKP